MQGIIEKLTNASVVLDFSLLTICKILNNTNISFKMKAVFKHLVCICKHAMDACRMLCNVLIIITANNDYVNLY